MAPGALITRDPVKCDLKVFHLIIRFLLERRLQAEHIMTLPPWRWVYLIDWHVWILVSLALFKNMKQSYDVLHIYWFHPNCVSQMIQVLWDWGCPEANCSIRNLSRLQHMVQLCFCSLEKDEWSQWFDVIHHLRVFELKWWVMTGCEGGQVVENLGAHPLPVCAWTGPSASGTVEPRALPRPRGRGDASQKEQVIAVEASSLLPICQPHQRQTPANSVWRMGKGSRHLWQ